MRCSGAVYSSMFQGSVDVEPVDSDLTGPLQ